MKYFFDTYALFEIINKNESYKKFFDEEIATSILNLGELYYGLLKDKGQKTASEWFDKLKNLTIPLSEDTVKKSMDFKLENKSKNFSFIDCIGFQLAKGHSLVFLAGDKEFQGMDNVEFVK